VQEQLEVMPTPPDLQQMSIILTTLINDFNDKIIRLFEGGRNADQYLLKSRWDRLAEAFRADLLNSRPKLQLDTKEESAQMTKAERLISEPITLSDEDAPSSSSKKENGATRSPVTLSQTFYSFGLEEIRQANQRHAITGLGPQMFPSARMAMIRKSVSKLTVISEKFLDDTFDLSEEHVAKHLEAVFRHFKHMLLYKEVMGHVVDFVEEYCR
jgi:hypothetical protein